MTTKSFLAELLQRSVRPTVDKVVNIEALVPPETHATAIYAEFHHARQELIDAYGRFGLQSTSPNVAADTDAQELGEMLMHSIEVVTDIRNAGGAVSPQRANRIAAAALRMCDVPNEAIATAASTATYLLEEFRYEDVSIRDG